MMALPTWSEISLKDRRLVVVAIACLIVGNITA
jgi:hypothetical protein